jgi:DNA-binding response OmpR family regulator
MMRASTRSTRRRSNETDSRMDIMRVLLVEDSHDLRQLFARVLKRSGFEVCEATNGREALELLIGFDPDVILTDLMMPEVDGYELIRRIRAMPAMANVPIVAMTAAASDEAVRHARRVGAADLLEKPLDTRTLLDRVGALGSSESR